MSKHSKTTLVVDAPNMDIAFRIARCVDPDISGAQPFDDTEYKEYHGSYYVVIPGGKGYRRKKLSF